MNHKQLLYVISADYFEFGFVTMKKNADDRRNNSCHPDLWTMIGPK
jgi:hypothetical protein